MAAATVVLAACVAGPSATPGGPLAAVPTPPGATVEIGAANPGLDQQRSFVAYRSDLAPDRALAAYDAVLVAAGYQRAASAGGWYVYQRDGVVVMVSVSSDGPPTAILVQLAGRAPEPDPATERGGPTPAGASAGESLEGGSPVPGTPEPPSRLHPGTKPPGKGGTPPGKVVSPPSGQTSPSPVPPGSPDSPGPTPAPDQGGTPPGKGGIPPGKGGTPPGKGANQPPAQDGTPPGQDGSSAPDRANGSQP